MGLITSNVFLSLRKNDFLEGARRMARLSILSSLISERENSQSTAKIDKSQ